MILFFFILVFYYYVVEFNFGFYWLEKSKTAILKTKKNIVQNLDRAPLPYSYENKRNSYNCFAVCFFSDVNWKDIAVIFMVTNSLWMFRISPPVFFF